MRRRNVVVGMLVGLAMMVQMVMPVMAKADADEVDKDTYCVPKSEVMLEVAPPPSEFEQAQVSEPMPEATLVGVYTAWDEVLPVGLKTERSNILGTDRVVMAGKFIDCVVAVDLPEDREIDTLKVGVTIRSNGIQTTVSVGDVSTKTSADVQLADDIVALVPDAPRMTEDELCWHALKWPCVVTEDEIIELPLIGQAKGETGTTFEAYTNVGVADLQLGDSRHFEVVFRLYALAEQDFEAYDDYHQPRKDPNTDDNRHLSRDVDFGGSCGNAEGTVPWEPTAPPEF